MHPARTHSRLASGAVLSAAVLGATLLAPLPAHAGPGEGALGLDISVVKTDSATGEALEGAVFEIETDIDEAHIVTEGGVDFDYGWTDFRPTCDLPSWEDPEHDAALDDCRRAFLQDAYGDVETSTVTAPGGFRVFSPMHSGGWPPWDSGSVTLTEVEAPEGYVIGPESIVITFEGDAYSFSVSGPEGVTIEAPERGAYTQSATVTIPNDPEPEEPEEPEPSETPEPTPTPTPESSAPTTPPPPAAPDAPAPKPGPELLPGRAGPIVQTGASGSASVWDVLSYRIHSLVSTILD